MSSKSTIFLTSDNEHFYLDCSEPLLDKEGNRKYAITLEFSKNNIRIDLNDDEDLVITLINPDSDIYNIFKTIKQ